MAIFLSLLFLLVSSASACDRCAHTTKAAYFQDSALSSGACGYGPLALEFNNKHIAAATPSIFKNGTGCGACYQVRCKNPKVCSTKGTTVIVTDRNQDSHTGFVLSTEAFTDMAIKGMGQNLMKLGLVDVEYKKVPCQYQNKNLAIFVEQSSQRPYYLAVKLLHQGGQTVVVRIDVALASSSNWIPMTRNYGAVWDTSKSSVPKGALKFRFTVVSGTAYKMFWTKEVLPADWKSGVAYDSWINFDGIIASENCSTCDDGMWK